MTQPGCWYPSPIGLLEIGINADGRLRSIQWLTTAMIHQMQVDIKNMVSNVSSDFLQTNVPHEHSYPQDAISPLWDTQQATFVRFRTMVGVQQFLSIVQKKYFGMESIESLRFEDGMRIQNCLDAFIGHRAFLSDTFPSIDWRQLKTVRLESRWYAICRQLDAYFFGQRTEFSLPMHLPGTPFTRQVLQNTFAIPYGETRTYQQIAHVCGRPSAARAVGQILHRNPLPIVVPCHRVIGKTGALVGFSSGLFRKWFLLRLEHQTRIKTVIKNTAEA